MSEPAIAMIVAMGRNRVIGADNAMPWHIPSELKYFKETTWGKPMVMGRKTFESIGRPLPGRETVIVTRDAGYRVEGAQVTHELDVALTLATTLAEQMEADEVIIAGGAQIYAQALPFADRLYLTEIDLAPEGDSLFPEIDETQWREVSRYGFAAETDPKTTPAYVKRVLERA